MVTNHPGMSEEELQEANVVTAPEIWFIHNSKAQEVRDPSGTFLRKIIERC